eukprot:14605090-Alexandrium_andersonii.AAC.1
MGCRPAGLSTGEKAGAKQYNGTRKTGERQEGRGAEGRQEGGRKASGRHDEGRITGNINRHEHLGKH